MYIGNLLISERLTTGIKTLSIILALCFKAVLLGVQGSCILYHLGGAYTLSL